MLDFYLCFAVIGVAILITNHLAHCTRHGESEGRGQPVAVENT